MGNSKSQEEQANEELDHFVKRLSKGPDLRVNKTIKMFTCLNSSVNLTQHYEKRKMKTGGRAADWIKSLVEKLGALTPAPELAGLGALAIAILIDNITDNFSGPPEESTKEALRCVFAEEKASEVWNLIDECLKRCVMHIKNKDKLVGEIEQIEVQLSAAITRLKNLRHMTSEALKAWVNGAAFHIQVLIYLVRLGGNQSCDPVERLISTYLSDLDLLFKKHKELIRGKCCCELGFTTFWGQDVYQECFVDEDSKWHGIPLELPLQWSRYFEVYYDHRYDGQRRGIQQDFTQVKENLQELVHQRGSFNIN